MRKKTALLIIFSLVASLAIGFGYTRIVEGFDESRIYLNHPFDSRWETPPLPEKQQIEIKGILAQKFYYLAKGCQVYAFISEDGNYILKFFKCQHLRKKLIEYFPPLPLLVDYQRMSQERRNAKYQLLFQGYKIAFEFLPDETGILFLHLNQTDTMKQKVTLYNKLGIKQTIDLDGVEFVLQKRAQPFYSTIVNYMESGRIDKVDTLFQQLIELLRRRNLRGVRDKDYLLADNVGVTEEGMIILDPGQFVVDDSVKNQEFYTKDIEARLVNLYEWLRQHYPELQDHLRAAYSA